MNILDIVLIIPLLYGAWRAFNKGFIMALFTILALLIGLYAAFHFSDKFSRFISAQTDSMPEYLPAFSFLILFLLVGACIYFGGKALQQVIKIAQLSLVNKLLGAALGLIKWVYLISGLLVFIDAVDLKQQFLSKELKSKSIIYPLVNGIIRNSIPDVAHMELFKHRKLELKK